MPASRGPPRFHNLSLILETYSVTDVMDCLQANPKENVPEQMADLLAALLAHDPERTLIESLEHVQSLSQWSRTLFPDALRSGLERLQSQLTKNFDNEEGWSHLAGVLATVVDQYPGQRRYVLDLLGKWTHYQNSPKNKGDLSLLISVFYSFKTFLFVQIRPSHFSVTPPWWNPSLPKCLRACFVSGPRNLRP